MRVKLVVSIEVDAPSVQALVDDIQADRELKDNWFSPQDGDRILVDDAYLNRARVDDSFFAFELVGVMDEKDQVQKV
jgi:hypothetical protein